MKQNLVQGRWEDLAVNTARSVLLIWILAAMLLRAGGILA